jgi:hypothetical protein
MGFVTIPDITNSPVMINTDCVVCVTIDPSGIISLHMSNGLDIETTVPRQILVDMLTKVSQKPTPVQPTTEWAG